MKSKKLHILNGDATRHQIEKTKIEGDVFVWSEILCEGPTTPVIGANTFWETRKKFLKQFVGEAFGKTFYSFQQKFEALDLEHYDEITLWFEYDLFCQINMLGVLAWISQQDLVKPIVFLICVGSGYKPEKLVGLGEIDPKDFPLLLKKRSRLTKEDLLYASEAWNLYCKDRPDQLVDYAQNNPNPKYEYLLPALKYHLWRFPNMNNGLTWLEEEVLTLLTKKTLSERDVVKYFLVEKNIFGYGDLQYFTLLKQMENLISTKDGLLYLSELGIKVKSGQLNFQQFRKDPIYYGGANILDYTRED